MEKIRIGVGGDAITSEEKSPRKKRVSLILVLEDYLILRCQTKILTNISGQVQKGQMNHHHLQTFILLSKCSQP